MKQRSDLQFDVRWLPFQLNPDAPEQPTSKMEGYMRKFGKSREEVAQMAQWMGGKFREVDLPYNFTDSGLVSNTFEAHRVLTAAYEQGGDAAQDKAAEVLFHGYFADERAPNDVDLLRSAAEAAGLDGAELVANKDIAADKTREEFLVGKRMGVTGVPHFSITSGDGSRRPLEVSGAQPPEQLLAAFDRVARGV
eukprot:TRINITY_DN19054_c0_g1_i1.p1 TRINITY_DN19054_c0_g1~~TRINITY_DN19054_c0_g1_i1.p1  ORF type:complete len:194 (-),score=39.62 TRINITY_DN19054_c0_g1_i1:135-716(-)